MMQNRADAVDAFLVHFLAFPFQMRQLQSLGLRDDHNLRCHPRRVVGRQSAGNLLQMLKSHFQNGTSRA